MKHFFLFATITRKSERLFAVFLLNIEINSFNTIMLLVQTIPEKKKRVKLIRLFNKNCYNGVFLWGNGLVWLSR